MKVFKSNYINIETSNNIEWLNFLLNTWPSLIIKTMFDYLCNMKIDELICLVFMLGNELIVTVLDEYY